MEYLFILAFLVLPLLEQTPATLAVVSAQEIIPVRIEKPPTTTTTAPVIVRPPISWMSPEQKRRAEQLTSIFENGTPQFDYRAIENLGDGRGYTAGRAGFTTATGDAYLVIERYTKQVPTNPLATYLPRLKQLADDEDEDTSQLPGFVDAWRLAALDSRFRSAQDAVIDELYYVPAMQVANQLGISSALGRAILYDTIIQHGGGDNEDSLSAIVERTTTVRQGTPKTGVSQTLWLNTFLDLRRQDLLRPANQTTQDVWAVSVGRVEVLRKLLHEKNLDLNGPIIVDTEEYDGRIL